MGVLRNWLQTHSSPLISKGLRKWPNRGFIERRKDGIYDQAVIFEIDRGMEDKAKFRQHVLGRIDFLQSGEYKKAFNTNTVRIAYATTGQLPEYREARRKTM